MENERLVRLRYDAGTIHTGDTRRWPHCSVTARSDQDSVARTDGAKTSLMVNRKDASQFCYAARIPSQAKAADWMRGNAVSRKSMERTSANSVSSICRQFRLLLVVARRDDVTDDDGDMTDDAVCLMILILTTSAAS